MGHPKGLWSSGFQPIESPLVSGLKVLAVTTVAEIDGMSHNPDGEIPRAEVRLGVPRVVRLATKTPREGGPDQDNSPKTGGTKPTVIQAN
jgi:hypothetical protein